MNILNKNIDFLHSENIKLLRQSDCEFFSLLISLSRWPFLLLTFGIKNIMPLPDSM